MRLPRQQPSLGSDAPSGDEGFTLVEVIWALFLLGVIAMGALMLFLNGMTAMSDMQRQQVAASLASTALDQARAVTGTAVNTTGTSGLVKGRTSGAVTAVWNEATALDASLTSDMTLDAVEADAWDPAPGMTEADQWVPVRTTQTVGTQDYTIDTLIGICYRLKSSPHLDQPCTRNRQTVDDAIMFRVRVLVQWDTGTADGADSYSVSTLVDPSDDTTWNTALLPYAYDDEFTVVAGGAASFHAIVANDAVDMGSGNPIVNTSAPAAGSFTLGTGDSKNGVFFTPPSDMSGTVTFTYGLRDVAGQFSPTVATVMVHILPSPRSDDLTVEPGTTTELNELLLENDIGVENLQAPDRRTTIVPFIDPSVDYFETEEVTPEMQAARDNDIAALAARGVTVAGDGTVTLAAPDTVGETVAFSYYLVDDGDDAARYPNTGEPASVTITTEEAALEVADGEFTFDATASQTFHEIDWRSLAENEDEDDLRIRILDASPGSETHIRLDGTVGDTTTLVDVLEFRTLSSNVGIHEYEYVLVSPGGSESDPATMTVTVAPVAGDLSDSLRRGRSSDLELRTLGIPNSGVRVTSLGSPTCGSVSLRPDGRVRFTAPNGGGSYPRTCTFTYKVETTGTPAIESQDPGTVAIQVNR